MSSNYRTGTVGQSFQLRYSTDRELSGLFVQCKIYDSTDVLKATVNLTESLVQAGRYIGDVVLNVADDYEAFYIPYDDAGHTIESEMSPRSSELINITETETKFGGATLPPSGGITDADIQEIIAGVRAALHIDNPWDYELTSGRTAEEELIAKSEFNHKKDEVKIPKIDLSKIQNEIISHINDKAKELDRMLNNVLMDISQLKNKKELKEIDLAPVYVKIDALGNRFGSLKPIDYKNELSDIRADLNEINKVLLKVEKKETPKTDLKPLIEKMSSLNTLLDEVVKKESFKDLMNNIEELNKCLGENKDLMMTMDDLQLERFNKLLNFIKKMFLEAKTQEEGRTSKMMNKMLNLMEKYED